MQHFPIIMAVLIVLVLITRLLTVVFHELGHAIPLILLTKQKATVYIGSHGNPQKSVRVNLGLLVIFLRYNPLKWQLGLCVPSCKNISINKQIIYTLTGPLTSIMIAVVSCYFVFTYDLHGSIKIFLVVFSGSAVFDLLINIIPSNAPIKLHDGKIIYNDGHQLQQLFYYKRLPKEYSKAADFYNEQKFSEAAILFESLLKKVNDENIYQLAIHSYLQSKNYKKAKELSDDFLPTGKMNSDDLSNAGLSYSQLGLHEEALKLYDKSLELNPDNKYSLNNKGYTLNLVNKFEDAIHYFNKAIQLDKDYAYSYNNRGLAKIKSGQEEEGLEDINHSFKLDPDNSYAYRNLGIYHFDKGELAEALRLFTRSRELDESTHMIDELINNTRDKLERR